MKTRGFFSKFLVAMLSFLGVACQGVDLYGSPVGEFKIIEGNVTDESSHPLQGAKLTLIDGSSRLADGHQWHTYPAVSIGWNIAKENFMKGSKVDDLLISAS